MVEQINKPVKKRPIVSANQIRKFEYEGKADVVQFDVSFPEITNRTFVVRLDEGFSDDDLLTGIEAKRAEAEKQKALNEAAKADITARLDKIYPEPELAKEL